MGTFVKTLRDRKPLDFFEKKTKYFIHFQLNKKEKSFVCWQRFVSLDRKNWREWNSYLSLKDVLNCISQINN